jgi:phage-related protein
MPEHRRQWRFHPAARKELDALPQNGREGLLELMGRIRNGDPVLPREADNYGQGLRGLKYSESHNEFRCYFAHHAKHGQILVAVGFAYKKDEKADLSAARARLAEWEAEGKRRLAARNPGGRRTR